MALKTRATRDKAHYITFYNALYTGLYFYLSALTVLRYYCFEWRQAEEHTPLFHLAVSQGPLALVNRIIAIHRARLKTLMFISRQNVVGDNENITSWTLSFILSPPRYLLLFTSYLISIHKETLHEFRSAIRGGHNLLLTIIKKQHCLWCGVIYSICWDKAWSLSHSDRCQKVRIFPAWSYQKRNGSSNSVYIRSTPHTDLNITHRHFVAFHDIFCRQVDCGLSWVLKIQFRRNQTPNFTDGQNKLRVC